MSHEFCDQLLCIAPHLFTLTQSLQLVQLTHDAQGRAVTENADNIFKPKLIQIISTSIECQPYSAHTHTHIRVSGSRLHATLAHFTRALKKCSAKYLNIV